MTTKGNMTNKKTFEEALRLMMESANCMALSRKLGRNEYFISNAASSIRKGQAVNKRTIDDLYAVFPMLKELVDSGLVTEPKKRKSFNSSPEHMAKMRNALIAKRAGRPDGTVNELLIQVSQLRSALRAAFPEKQHLF